jgi:hypothetical protein
MSKRSRFDIASAPAWLSAGVDAGGVPSLLERLATTVPPDSIDELWLFPTRRLSGYESTVIVLSRYTDETDRRRVETVHFKATRNKRGEAQVETVLEDHAVAPADRLTRVIDGVLRRLGDELSAAPRAVRISGDVERWHALVESTSANVELEEALERVRERAQLALRRASTELDAQEEAEPDQDDVESDRPEDEENR